MEKPKLEAITKGKEKQYKDLNDLPLAHERFFNYDSVKNALGIIANVKKSLSDLLDSSYYASALTIKADLKDYCTEVSIWNGKAIADFVKNEEKLLSKTNNFCNENSKLRDYLVQRKEAAEKIISTMEEEVTDAACLVNDFLVELNKSLNLKNLENDQPTKLDDQLTDKYKSIEEILTKEITIQDSLLGKIPENAFSRERFLYFDSVRNALSGNRGKYLFNLLHSENLNDSKENVKGAIKDFTNEVSMFHGIVLLDFEANEESLLVDDNDFKDENQELREYFSKRYKVADRMNVLIKSFSDLSPLLRAFIVEWGTVLNEI